MRKLPFSVYGLALLCALQASAGTLGNGHGVIQSVAKAHYSFCWGAWPRSSTAYFSAVITSAPSLKNPNLETAFRSYLHQTFAVGSATECFIALSMDGAVAVKKQEEDSLVLEQKFKIVETSWTGPDVPSVP